MEKVYADESAAKIEEWSRMSERAKCELPVVVLCKARQLIEIVKNDRQFETYRATIWVSRSQRPTLKPSQILRVNP